ncbi:hypothetical protein [Nocardioides marmotae]|uniref:ECF transporter S component n=1 Tax=Nocardioides marmotae TaxID=2663857 RepID=A0A6I3J005_9ACTN|nr:hypothetical protein [Nocardioides marmotae]MCR6030707.1 hypothetical protein [Gordonia jinghuaiqii]MBC9734025.1 hypothetical protein [Nocardioides marmotae]MTB85128.1 hypothetical protein [Nocardioides marmotae]MTB94341.1 hypothetical protein [Nocardioides marmotae]QKE01631.1 hypothetical protein HPC71_11470 [Nocardioides marmotae]
MKGWSAVGTPRPWSALVALAWLAGGLLWVGWPVWDSVGVPSREQVRLEAPWVLAAQTTGLVLLAATVWREGSRQSQQLTAVVGLVAADCFLRAVLTPGAGGVEVVHALPLLAGAGLGLAAGVLTGASAALVSTMLFATPAETLPAQCLVWAVVGALGAALRWVPTLAAWLAMIPLAVGVGIVSGALLNLIGWAQDAGTTTDHFAPGLPPGEVLARLWSYTVETSLAYDTIRGLTTALLVATLGLPVLRALRGPALRGATTPRSRTGEDLAAAVRRREDSSAIARLWATAPAEQEKE